MKLTFTKAYVALGCLCAVAIVLLAINLNIRGNEDDVELKQIEVEETLNDNAEAVKQDVVIAGESRLAPLDAPESVSVISSSYYEKSILQLDLDGETELQSVENTKKTKKSKEKKAKSLEGIDEPEKEEVIVKFTSPKTGFVYMINITQLDDAWDNAEPFEWDNMDCHQRVAVIKNFLIDQMGVNENIAFGIMGNSANEGTFGMEQSTHEIFKNTDDAVKKLCNSKVHRGYGIIQWTSMFRREALAEFYKAAEKIDINFREVMFIAELVYMYEEVVDYKLFTSYKEQVELEDACGRVAREYEGYAGSETDWRKRNGKYTITNTKGTGYKRYTYSKKFKELWGNK